MIIGALAERNMRKTLKVAKAANRQRHCSVCVRRRVLSVRIRYALNVMEVPNTSYNTASLQCWWHMCPGLATGVIGWLQYASPRYAPNTAGELPQALYAICPTSFYAETIASAWRSGGSVVRVRHKGCRANSIQA